MCALLFNNLPTPSPNFTSPAYPNSAHLQSSNPFSVKPFLAPPTLSTLTVNNIQGAPHHFAQYLSLIWVSGAPTGMTACCSMDQASLLYGEGISYRIFRPIAHFWLLGTGFTLNNLRGLGDIPSFATAIKWIFRLTWRNSYNVWRGSWLQFA